MIHSVRAFTVQEDSMSSRKSLVGTAIVVSTVLKLLLNAVVAWIAGLLCNLPIFLFLALIERCQRRKLLASCWRFWLLV